MKKKILVSTLIIGAFIAGYSINNIAVSNTNPNIALKSGNCHEIFKYGFYEVFSWRIFPGTTRIW